MILETVFAAADRAVWQKPGEWFSVDEYHDLGKFTCDGVALRSKPIDRKGKWRSGLAMAARSLSEDRVEVRIRATAYNPRGNHDKLVRLHFEVLNGEDVLTAGTMAPIRCPDSRDPEDGELTLVLPAASLRLKPVTRLRITMATEDY